MAEMPLLAIDVGNSRIKLGLFHAEAPGAGPLPDPRQWAVRPVEGELAWAEFEQWSRAEPMAAVIAGTNPQVVARIVDNWPIHVSPPPRVLTSASALPLKVHVDEPHQVGVDRLLNALAANRIRPAGQPAIVVGCGTATTVDLIEADGAFEGGAILPGIRLAARALHEHTAQLPLVDVDEAGSIPSAVGKNTRDAIGSGIVRGQIGAVKELIRHIQSARAGTPGLEVGDRPQPAVRSPQSVHVLLTGGGAALLAPHFPEARYHPHLTLTGLALAAQHLGIDRGMPESSTESARRRA